MPRRKRRSAEAFAAKVASKLRRNGEIDEGHETLVRETIAKEIGGEFDPAGVLDFELQHPLLWWWRAKVMRVIDGDTVDILIDRGFRDAHQERVRVSRIDAWEVRGRERAKGLKAKRWLAKHLTVNREFILHTTGPDPRGGFGRWLAELWLPITQEEETRFRNQHGKVSSGDAFDMFWDVARWPETENYPVLANLGEFMIELGHARPYGKG